MLVSLDSCFSSILKYTAEAIARNLSMGCLGAARGLLGGCLGAAWGCWR